MKYRLGLWKVLHAESTYYNTRICKAVKFLVFPHQLPHNPPSLTKSTENPESQLLKPGETYV